MKTLLMAKSVARRQDIGRVQNDFERGVSSVSRQEREKNKSRPNNLDKIILMHIFHKRNQNILQILKRPKSLPFPEALKVLGGAALRRRR
jgi:hypothetical protein